MTQANPNQRYEVHVAGDVSGMMAVGHDIIQVAPGGTAIVGDRKIEPTRVEAPVLRLPRPVVDFLDREEETRAALAATYQAAPTQIHGDYGAGRSSLLRRLAHEVSPSAFPDGVVFLSARERPAKDVQQLVFDAFYETELPFKAREADLRRGLHPLRAVVLLDDVNWSRVELEELLDLAPSCAFLLTSDQPIVGGGVRAVALGGLPKEHAVRLVEREWGEGPRKDDQDGPRRLAEALGGNPLRIVQAVALARESRRTLSDLAAAISASPDPDRAVEAEATGRLDDDERRVLAVLAVLAHTAVRAQQVSALAGVGDVETVLGSLRARSLVTERDGGYVTATAADAVLAEARERDEVTDRVLHGLARAAAASATAAEVAPDAGAFQAAARLASRRGDDPATRSLVRALGMLLPLQGCWGAWAEMLQLGRQAARRLGDAATEGWCLHELGTGSVMLGDPAGRGLLTEALAIRERLGDEAGAALTRSNLAWRPPSEPGDSGHDGGDSDDGGDADAGSGVRKLVGARTAGMLLVGAVGALVLWLLPPSETELPEIAFDPGAVTFADQTVGTPSPGSSVALLPTGATPIDSVRFSVAGPDAPDFRLDVGRCARAELQSVGGCTAAVSFQPTVAGPRSARIEAIAWPGAVGASMTVSGNGLEMVRRTARVTAAPREVRFGDVRIGGRSSSPVTIRNAGDTALAIRGVALDPEGEGPFRLVVDSSDGRTCTAGSLAAGAECTMEVVYAPDQPGEHMGRITVAHSGVAGSTVIAVVGTGLGFPVAEIVARTVPCGAAAPSQCLDFGSVRTGERGRQRIAVVNRGTAPLAVSEAAIVGPEPGSSAYGFEVDECSSRTVQAGEACNLLVTFAPRVVGTSTGAVQIVHDAEGSPERLTMRGVAVGTGRLAVDPGRVRFAEEEVGSTSPRQVVTLENAGDGPLSLASVTVTGAARGEFPAAHQCGGTTLPPGARCRVAVEFRPRAAGSRTAELVVTAGTDTLTVALVGTARARPTAPDLVVSGFSTNGNVRTDAAGARTVPVVITIENRGLATSATFKIAAHTVVGMAVALRVPGQDSWYADVQGLAAGASRRIAGTIFFPASMSGAIDLRTMVDSCSGDEFMPPYCRVQESDENNNTSSSIRVRAP